MNAELSTDFADFHRFGPAGATICAVAATYAKELDRKMEDKKMGSVELSRRWTQIHSRKSSVFICVRLWLSIRSASPLARQAHFFVPHFFVPSCLVAAHGRAKFSALSAFQYLCVRWPPGTIIFRPPIFLSLSFFGCGRSRAKHSAFLSLASAIRVSEGQRADRASIRHSSSSSSWPLVSTVCETSWRKSSRNRLRSLCTATRAAPGLIASRSATLA